MQNDTMSDEEYEIQANSISSTAISVATSLHTGASPTEVLTVFNIVGYENAIAISTAQRSLLSPNSSPSRNPFNPRSLLQNGRTIDERNESNAFSNHMLTPYNLWTPESPPDRHEQREPLACRKRSPANPFGSQFGGYYWPTRLDIALSLPLPDIETMTAHTWNPDDSSQNIVVKKNDHFTLHRHPVAQSTDCIRGKIGYSKGFHVWEITWPWRLRGSHAVVGVATKNAALDATGYISLVGSDAESYGWDLIRNKCYHDSKHTGDWKYPTLQFGSVDTMTAPDRFLCILDMDSGYLAFSSAKQYYGVAFVGLKGKVLYPIVSAVWGNCEITMKYISELDPELPSLVDFCCQTIRDHFGRVNFHWIDQFDLPKRVKDNLLH